MGRRGPGGEVGMSELWAIFVSVQRHSGDNFDRFGIQSDRARASCRKFACNLNVF